VVEKRYPLGLYDGVELSEFGFVSFQEHFVNIVLYKLA
jgi:predicted Zn-dependent protease with MMP-like domain